MDFESTPTSQAKRGRFEIRTIILIVLAVMVFGALYVALNGSPTRNRAYLDSDSNPAPIVNPHPRFVPPQH